MTKTLISLAAAAAVLTLSATAASAQPGPGHWVSINERQAMLDQRIDAGVRDGSLTRREAMRLRREFGAIAHLEAKYRADGLSGWERSDLEHRFDRLSAQIRDQRHDGQYRG